MGRLRWVWLVWLVLGVILPRPVAAQEQNAPVCDTEISQADLDFALIQPLPITFICYGVVIDLQLDGSFHVQEVQQVYFAEDGLKTGFSEIPLALTAGVQNVRVAELGQAYERVETYERLANTYAVTETAGNVFVDWAYEEVPAGEVRTFLVDYDVVGALWVYETGDILEYRAVTDSRDGIPVVNSRVVVNFPEAWDTEGIAADVFGATDFAEPIVTAEGVFYELTAPLASGVPFQVFVTFPHGLLAAEVQAWQEEEDSAALEYRFLGIETQLTIHDDGTLSIVEGQNIAVAAGALYRGFQNWGLLALDGVENLQVSEGGQVFREDEADCNYCFSYDLTPSEPNWVYADSGSGALRVDEGQAGRVSATWVFPPLVRGEATTFVLAYDVVGAIQVTEEGQAISWVAVSGYDVPVEQASVILDLPGGVRLEDVFIQGGELRRLEDDRIGVVHEGVVPAGEVWRVQISMPPDATTASQPQWQSDIAVALEEAEVIKEALGQAEIVLARQQLGFGVVGALVLIGGLLGVCVAWYLRGRDEEAEPVPTYLSEPPSSLAPGLVAYLIDEEANAKGILASLFHLASLGLLQIKLQEPLRLMRQWPELLVPGQVVELAGGETVVLPNHLIKLFNGLAYHMEVGALSTLSSLASKWHGFLPGVYAEMEREADTFFADRPDEARRRWLSRGQGLILAGLVIGFIMGLLYVPRFGEVALAPPLALVPIGMAMMVVSRWMAQRTDKGAEAWTKWEAFGNYLENLKVYVADDNEQAQAVLDKYFAYAIALGVEEVVLEQVEVLGGVMPRWTRPVTFMPFTEPLELTRPGLPHRIRVSNAPLGEITTPPPVDNHPPALEEERPSEPLTSLAGLSGRLTERLDTANRSLTDVLNTAVSDKADTPFEIIFEGTKEALKFTAIAGKSMAAVLNEVSASSAGGSGGYKGGSSGRSRSSFSSRSRSSSSGRSSSSRRSSGGGGRGFGR